MPTSVSFLKRSKIKNLLTCCQKFIGLNKAAKNSKNCCLLSRPSLTLSLSSSSSPLSLSVYLSHPLSHLLTYNTLLIFLPLLYNIYLTTSHTPTLSFPFSLPQTNGITFSDSKSVSLKTFFSIFVKKKIRQLCVVSLVSSRSWRTRPPKTFAFSRRLKKL